LFDSESEAREVFATIGGTAGSDGLAETPFMSADLLAPGYRCDGCFHGTHDDIAHHVGQASDVRAYIAAAWAESKGGQA
jgi:hypothetical protein